MTIKIPMSSPDLDDADRQAVLDVLRTPHLSMGAQTPAFEDAFRDLTGARHAIAVSSGTAGLHLCVRAAGLGAGDIVITTPFSFVASANVILYENAIPVFVDVDPETGNIDPGLVEEACRDLSEAGGRARRWLPRTGVPDRVRLRALLPVDVFGQPADYQALVATSDKHGLVVIEDACEALGSSYKGRLAGTFGQYGVFAFYPNKQITTGEGGVVITSDDMAAELMRALRNQGRAPGDTWLQHTHLGYNYRMDEMSASLGRAQMRRLDQLIYKRQQVANWYSDRLAEIAGVVPPVIAESTTRMSWFVYVIRLPAGVNRSQLAERLEARGIPVRPYFLPIHLQPYMVQRFGYRPGDFPQAEDAGNHGLALPFSGVMSEGQVDYVCAAIREALLATR